MVTITQEHIDLAKKLGACKVTYKIGQSISEVAASDLAWMAARAPELAASMASQLCKELGVVARAVLPLEFFGYGSGYGDGSGSGYGYGDGYGYGYGYGDGYGAQDIVGEINN